MSGFIWPIWLERTEHGGRLDHAAQLLRRADASAAADSGRLDRRQRGRQHDGHRPDDPVESLAAPSARRRYLRHHGRRTGLRHRRRPLLPRSPAGQARRLRRSKFAPSTFLAEETSRIVPLWFFGFSFIGDRLRLCLFIETRSAFLDWC